MTRKSNAQQTREKIVDVSAKLFAEKGYERTTMQDIVNDLGMSKGAIFHHFKSKEAIVEAVVTRYCDSFLDVARQTADDKSIPVYERFIKTALALQVSDADGGQMLAHLHSPQNALLHLQMEKAVLDKAAPILAGIVRDGVEQGFFDTEYPEEAIAMVLCYSNTAFDTGRIAILSREELLRKAKAFIDAVERLLGAEAGSMDRLIGQFERTFREGNGNDE
ncbi:MAG: TetR/AcrR family transcriptional regulator [Clostridium sp.]|jgi:AcrR family transcriptional regulator|nr:TetR/AcrR family transcriptional regulator [Clostridium sp.]